MQTHILAVSICLHSIYLFSYIYLSPSSIFGNSFLHTLIPTSHAPSIIIVYVIISWTAIIYYLTIYSSFFFLFLLFPFFGNTNCWCLIVSTACTLLSVCVIQCLILFLPPTCTCCKIEEIKIFLSQCVGVSKESAGIYDSYNKVITKSLPGSDFKWI